MSNLLTQLKKRRLALGMKQGDMMMRVGMSRQQYQRLESKGNPRLDTLELIASGVKSELMLIPQDKVAAVRAVLAGEKSVESSAQKTGTALADDPWKGLLEDDE